MPPLPGNFRSRSSGIRRVLVIKPSSFGDVLHVFPALANLHRAFPEARLDFLVSPAFEGVLAYSPFPVTRIIRFQRKRMGQWRHTVPEFLRLVRELRRERYDLVIDFQGLLRSGIFAFCARGPVGGFAAPREPGAARFYRTKVQVPPGLHAIERNLVLADALTGCGTALPELELPVLPGETADRPEGPYVALGIGARWHSKEFPVQLFARIATGIHKQAPECRFVAVGSLHDRRRAAELRRLLPPDFPLDDLTGLTDWQGLFGVLRNAAAVVCCDSGPMHAAALLKRPVFALFGPTRPHCTGPFWKGSRVIRREGLSCLGCMRHHCPGDYACFEIDADRVVREVMDAFQEKEP